MRSFQVVMRSLRGVAWVILWPLHVVLGHIAPWCCQGSGDDQQEDSWHHPEEKEAGEGRFYKDYIQASPSSGVGEAEDAVMIVSECSVGLTDCVRLSDCFVGLSCRGCFEAQRARCVSGVFQSLEIRSHQTYRHYLKKKRLFYRKLVHLKLLYIEIVLKLRTGQQKTREISHILFNC